MSGAIGRIISSKKSCLNPNSVAASGTRHGPCCCEDVDLLAVAGFLALSLVLALASAAGFLAGVFYLISRPALVYSRPMVLDSDSAAPALLTGDLAA